MADGRRFLVGLIGSDLGPSLSPALHERAADELGVRYVYQLIDINELGLQAQDVGDLVQRAQQLGFAGLNITHPCKQDVVAHLDRLSADATALRAVNTVVFEGRLAVGHNTDWHGFLTGFRRGLPDVRVHDVVLLGAGGAGAAVALALVRLGVRRLTVVDVAVGRAERLATAIREAGMVDDPVAIEFATAVTDVEDRIAVADGVVNATPVGMSGERSSPLPIGMLRPDLWVADIVYRPLETELLRRARAAGCRTLHGGGMVVAQAAEAFRLITGLTPDLERMFAHFTELTSTAAAA